MRFPFPQEDGTLTPYTFELAYPLMTLVYDTLLWRDAAGVPQPWLAEAVEVSADGRRVTVRLREGAAWHDGPPVTSEDVAFTFSYVRSHPHPRFTGEVRMVERVETPDPRTAVIVLRQPSPGFLDQPLADLPILPTHLWKDLPREKLTPDGLPVGSGPYRLVEHRLDERYRFEANPTYFRGSPAVSALEVPIIRTAADTVKALEQGNVDMVPVSLPESLADRVDTLSIKVKEGPSFLGTVLMFNLRAAPFDRAEVRRAVAGALDLRRISRVVGNAVPAERGYLHPDSAFASPSSLHRVDVAAARQVLRTLGAPIIVLAPQNDPVRLEAGRQVVQSLLGAGAAAELKEVSSDELSRAVGEDGTPPSFQAAIWLAPPLASYDPDFLARLFGSDPTVAPFNYSGFRSEAFDQAGQRFSTSQEPDRRKLATADALRILATDVPVVPLFFAGGAFAFRSSVYDGWVYVKGTGILDKRSFVEAAAAGPSSPTTTSAIGTSGPGEGKAGLSAAGVIAVGVLSLSAVLALFATFTSLRERISRRR